MLSRSLLLKLSLLVVTFFGNVAFAVAMTLPGEPDGYVNDFADILTADEEYELELLVESFEKEESSEIAIVTINSLEGEVIEEYAYELFNEWGIGKADKDNGVLILAAMDDREVRIEVGYGLEGALTDYESKMIIEDVIVPAFQNEDYKEGFWIAANDVIEAIEGEYEGGSYPPSSFFDYAPIIFIVLGILFFVLVIFLLAKYTDFFKGGGSGGSSSGYGGGSSSGYSSGSSSSSSSSSWGGSSSSGGSSFGGGSSGGGGASGRW